MSKKTIINTKLAPAAIGTYSQGIVYENLIFTSGQIPINPNTNKVVSNKFNIQVDQVLYNLNQVLKAAGSNKNNIMYPSLNDVQYAYCLLDVNKQLTNEVSGIVLKKQS